ncbi:transposase [Caballeronia udeis]|uniref:Transposase n=1 Tax=Caballeronia udeis TaxID=1232866 RepID=A0A158I5S3_9BURK|nr:transposase [Caballeronia udeis]
MCLYMSSPEHALVLCCDEKSQMQALDRTQPGLPLKRSRASTQTHDYKRHGTTTPFATLNTLNGSVTAHCEFRADLRIVAEHGGALLSRYRYRTFAPWHVPLCSRSVLAIKEYIVVHNQDPIPFMWTATAIDILQKVTLANSVLVPRKTKHYTINNHEQGLHRKHSGRAN